MNTLGIESLAITPTLRSTVPGVLMGIEEHKRFIGTCGDELQGVFWPYVIEREDARLRWRHPNLIVPFLLNELFNVSDTGKLRTICSAYLACDHFTHLLDDLADERQREDGAMLAHASHAMLSRGRRLYLDLASDPRTILQFFESYLEKAMQGEQWLWKRTRNVSPYTEKDLEMLRARGGMVNACIAAYCDLTDRWQLWNRLDEALGAIVVRIQLLDDVVDVESDFGNGIYTMPLAAAISSLGEPTPSWERVAERLLEGSDWKNTIVFAVSYLNRGCIELEKLDLLSLCGAIRGIEESARQLAEAITGDGIATEINSTERISKILRLPMARNLDH